MKRKTPLVLLLALILVLALAACESTDYTTPVSDMKNSKYSTVYELGLTYESPTAPNELMGNASAANSAFMFYVFDGETVLSKIFFQSVQGIIDELQSIPAARVTDWTLDNITLPVYGIKMGTTCGHSIRAAWSNGFWITQTGDVYGFDFDFEAFIKRQQWELLRNDISFTGFPNAINLTRDSEGWRNTLLTPAAELNPPEGIEMAFVSNTNENVTFTLTNNNDVYWLYGLHFKVDVLLDGVWYEIPTLPANWGFTGIGLTLEAGQTETKTYGLGMYGELPPGTYRLVVYDMYVVFEIN
ncbi:MAG: hypothetical protein FWC33_01100 [Candidatus Bathyarchaeota archaeon]|nr:hypothetical protein [Candidatus Termiticorpusculum sp.]